MTRATNSRRKAVPIRSMIKVEEPSSSSASFNCQQCDLSFEYKYLLIVHELSHRKSRDDPKETVEVSNQEEKLNFICDKCGLVFLSKFFIIKHLQFHKLNFDKFPFKCEFCTEKFERNALLKQHKLSCNVLHQIKNPESEVRCEDCNFLTTKSSDLQRHRSKEHYPVRRYCEFCEKSFGLVKLFKLHQIWKHSSELRNFWCPYCVGKKDFWDVKEIKNHIMEVHRKDLKTEAEKSEKDFFLPTSIKFTAKPSSTNSPKIATEKLFEIKLKHSKPPQIPKPTFEKSTAMIKIVSLNQERKKSEENSGEIQTIYKNGKTVINPMSLMNSEGFKAQKGSATKSELTDPEGLCCDPDLIVKQEMQEFGEYQVTSYNDVGEVRREDSFNDFKQSTSIFNPHLQQQQHLQCDLCDFICTSKFSMKNHMRAHKNPKIKHFTRILHKCPQCSFTSFFPEGIRNHQLVFHQGIQCKICHKNFNSQITFDRHQRNFHSEVLKNYNCGICGKFFKNMNYVKRHIKTTHVDNKFPCTYCNQSFPTRGELNTHVGSFWRIGKCWSFMNIEAKETNLKELKSLINKEVLKIQDGGVSGESSKKKKK